jgi:hypothetical protein
MVVPLRATPKPSSSAEMLGCVFARHLKLESLVNNRAMQTTIAKGSLLHVNRDFAKRAKKKALLMCGHLKME